MSTAVEITGVPSDFIVDRLKSDSQLAAFGSKGVHDIEIPQANTRAERDAIYPCCLVNAPVYRPDLLGNGDLIVWSPGEYEVTAIGLIQQFRKLEQMAGRIHQLLHGFFGDAPNGGYINSCRRIRPVRTPQPTNGVTFLRVGGLYLIAARLQSS